MAKSEYDILHGEYSSIPFVRDRQEEKYLKTVISKIQEVFNSGVAPSTVREDLTKLLNEVYQHQKLENRKMPEQLVLFIERKMLEVFGKGTKFTYMPEAVNSVRNQVGRYSSLPFVKKKQMAINRRLISESKKIMEMSGKQLTDRYIEELEAAQKEGRKPYKTLLDAIDQRREEVIANSKNIVKRWSMPGRGEPIGKDRDLYAKAWNDLEDLNGWQTKGDSTFSNNSKRREKELKNEISIVRIVVKLNNANGAVEKKKILDAELHDLELYRRKELAVYRRFLEQQSAKVKVEYESGMRELEKVEQELAVINEADANITKSDAKKEEQTANKESAPPIADFENGESISDRAGTFR